MAAEKPALSMPDPVPPVGDRLNFGPELGQERDVPSNSRFWEPTKARPSIDQVADELPDMKLLCKMVYVLGTLLLSREESDVLRERSLVVWRRFGKYCG
jgi:hypothetical protein